MVGWNANDICVCLSLPDLSCTFYTINFAFRSVLYSRLALSYDITSHYSRFSEFYCIGRYIVKYFIGGILREDFITAKRAMGLPKKRIVYSHALKNAGPPIITAIALSLAGSFGGSIIIEAVFDWPGMGKLYYDAISVMDVPIIIGLTYMFTLIFVITIFVTDIIYAFLDPRVKVG